MPLSWTVATTLCLGCKNEGFPLNYIWTDSKITVRSGIVGNRFRRCGSAFLYMKGNDPDSPAELNARRKSCWSVTSFVRLHALLNQTQGLEKLLESPGSQPCADVNVLPGPTLGGVCPVLQFPPTATGTHFIPAVLDRDTDSRSGSGPRAAATLILVSRIDLLRHDCPLIHRPCFGFLLPTGVISVSCSRLQVVCGRQWALP